MKKTPFIYRLLRLYVRAIMYLYCADIKMRKDELLSIKGPLLITANHPNSFFDALVFVTHFKSPMYFLARGDVFQNETIAKILRWLHIIPIHRITEGPENLHLNEQTFEECRQIFRGNGIVLIFIEGLSLNNYELRPFKKGSARLAISSWLNSENEKNLQILPVGINYNHFKGFGKKIFIEMNSTVSKNDFAGLDGSGKSILSFNETVRKKLEDLIIHPNEKVFGQKRIETVFSYSENFPELNKHFSSNDFQKHNHTSKIVLFLPAVIGMLMHAPLYLPLKNIIQSKTKGTVFFDSVLFGCLLFAYPVYTILLIAIAYCIIGSPLCFTLIILLPLTAGAATLFKSL